MPPADPRPERQPTKQELVTRSLRDAIMTCQLVPGQRLVIEELARRFDVSAIPVREALQTLQSEGLVQVVPHAGASVSEITRESIVEVFTVLEGLESVAARGAAERATPQDLDTLDRCVAEMDAILGDDRHQEWADLNTRFHLAIGRISGLRMLEEMTAQVLARWDRVRRWYFDGVFIHRADTAQEEHRQIVDAIARGDAARAEALARRHNRGALADYAAYLERAAGPGAEPAAGRPRERGGPRRGG